MATTFNTSGNYYATVTSAVVNSDGSYTYKATIPGLPMTWNDGANNHSCTATVEITIEAPDTTPVMGHGNMFRLGDSGGYNVHISGTDFS